MHFVDTDRFHQWWDTMEANPQDTALHLQQLEGMLEEGLPADELEFVVYDLLEAFPRMPSLEHREHLERVLLWVCGRVQVCVDLITGFIYHSERPHVHAFEELLMRYEGLVIPMRYFGQGEMTTDIPWHCIDSVQYFDHCPMEYIETLLGYPNVIHIRALQPIYEEQLRKRQEVDELDSDEDWE